MVRIKNIETNDEDFIMSVCIFLEDFRKLSKTDKQKALNEEIDGNVWDFENNAVIAAICEKLANDNKLEVPTWVDKPKYFLKEPLFEYDTKNIEYQKFLIEDAPKEFSRRNIYYGKNCIDRY